MIDDIVQAVFTAMKPGCWYRPADLAKQLGIETDSARYALNRLVNGGLVEREGDTNRRVYLSHQRELDLGNSAAA